MSRLSRRRLLAALGLPALCPAPRAAWAASPAGPPAATPPLPAGDPDALGLLPDRLAVADALVAGAVADGGIPGAVLLIACRGAVALHKAYGYAAVRPCPRPMTPETVFDLASLTKPVATSTAVARLLEEGRVELDAPVGRYLPPFAAAGGDKARITVRHLLTHAGGLPAGGAYAGKTRTTRQIVAEIAQARQIAPPGERFLYSDFSFLVLGALVEAVTGSWLPHYCQDTVFAPLGMAHTRYLPGPRLAPHCAATTAGDDTPGTRGRVHDPTARALGGVAGHAGLFSTADDLARFCQMLLNGGRYGGAHPPAPNGHPAHRQAVAFRGQRPRWAGTSTPPTPSAARSARLVRPHRLHRHVALDRPAHPDVRHPAHQRRPRPPAGAFQAQRRHRAAPCRFDRRRGAVAIMTCRPGRGAYRRRSPPPGGPRAGADRAEALLAEDLRRLGGRRLGVVCNHTAVDRRGAASGGPHGRKQKSGDRRAVRAGARHPG